jgi:hypothetical protein
MQAAIFGIAGQGAVWGIDQIQRDAPPLARARHHFSKLARCQFAHHLVVACDALHLTLLLDSGIDARQGKFDNVEFLVNINRDVADSDLAGTDIPVQVCRALIVVEQFKRTFDNGSRSYAL